MKTIAFVNNKGGDGTILVYHLAWMYAELGLNVVAADLDPQANLSSIFLPEDRLEELWPDGEHPNSVLGAIQPILKGIGDVANPHVESLAENITLIVGDFGLSAFEEKLSDAWPRCHDRDESAFRVLSAFHRLVRQAAQARAADLVLIDMGPNLGEINRAAMIAARHVAIPLAPISSLCKGCETWARLCAVGARNGRTAWNGLLIPVSICLRAKCSRPATSSCNMPYASIGQSRHIVAGWSGFHASIRLRCSMRTWRGRMDQHSNTLCVLPTPTALLS